MRRSFFIRAGAALPAAIALAACGQSTASNQTGASGTAGAGGAKPAVRIGSTNFSEQLVVGELYGQVLETNGYRVERRFNLGAREIVAPALEKGEFDLVAEYLASYVTFITKDEKKATTDAATTHKNLQDALTPRGLTVLDFAPAVDVNGFAVTKATADKHRLTRLSDLGAVAKDLVLGGPPECPQREFCAAGLEKTYGLKFKDFRPLDVGGPLTVAALKANQVDVGVLFTTDAVIQAEGFVLLQDDKKLQLADNIAPVVRTDLLGKAPADFRTLLNGVSKALTTEELTGLNRKVGIDKQDPKTAAAAWLKGKSLIK
jgi:osmoprotectant transport system substrate-binding protein